MATPVDLGDFGSTTILLHTVFNNEKLLFTGGMN